MKVNKAYEITDAKIQFVSLVDKAANLKSFLITKAAGGQATFSTYGRIVAKDADHHFVTGIVYEPLAEDAHGNYMTESEITKAAYYFAKAGGRVDLQHSFEPLKGAEVVESWIAKADFDVEGQTIKKGTWLMTVELADDQIWSAIEKGEITGFSMGGVGNYSEEDVDLTELEKSATETTEAQQDEKKGLFKRMAELFGLHVVEKGEFQESYDRQCKAQNFWAAFESLQGALQHWDSFTGEPAYEGDPATITEALTEFSAAIQDVLAGGEPVAKALVENRPVEKAGKKISSANRNALQGIYENLGTFLAQFDEPEPEQAGEDDEGENQQAADDEEAGGETEKEENQVTKAEAQKMVDEAIEKALAAQQQQASDEMNAETVQKMVDEAVEKALAPKQDDEAVTAEAIEKMVGEAVEKAVAPVLKARGVPSAMNDSGSTAPVEKQHYLHGLI